RNAAAGVTAPLHAAVSVLETDDVVEVGGRGLEDVAVGDGLHPVDGAGGDAEALALADRDLLQLLDGGARPESHLPTEQVDRLVLALVVLEREGVPRLHVQ